MALNSYPDHIIDILFELVNLEDELLRFKGRSYAKNFCQNLQVRQHPRNPDKHLDQEANFVFIIQIQCIAIEVPMAS